MRIYIYHYPLVLIFIALKFIFFTKMDRSSSQNTKLLVPHKYPIWLQVYVCLLIFLCYYSFLLLPDYIIATEKFQLGLECSSKKEYISAIHNYEDALDAAPTSKKITLAIAKAYFSCGSREDCFKAITYLRSIEIDKSDLLDLITVMPTEYNQYLNLANKR